MHAAMTHLWLPCSKGHIMCTGLSLQVPGLLQARVGMLARRGHQVLAQRLAALLIQRRHILRVRTCMPPAQVRATGLEQLQLGCMHQGGKGALEAPSWAVVPGSADLNAIAARCTTSARWNTPLPQLQWQCAREIMMQRQCAGVTGICGVWPRLGRIDVSPIP